MNKKIICLLSLVTLFACNGNQSSNDSFISSNTSNSDGSHSTSNQTSDSSENGSFHFSISFPYGNTTSDTKTTTSSTETPQTSSESTALSVSLAIATNKLKNAVQFDNELKSLKTSQYFIYEEYYQKQFYDTTRYLNNVTFIKGTTTNTIFSSNTISTGNYLEQKHYLDGTYYDIRKFDENNTSFMNTASKSQMSEDSAKNNLKINQASDAYQTYQRLANDYSDSLEYTGYYNEDDSIYASFMTYEAATDDYAFAIGMEFTIDKDNHLTDFYFTQGYYYIEYCIDYDVHALRRHGPTSYYEGGTTLEATNFVYGNLEEFSEVLPYAIEDNFVTSVGFKEETIELTYVEGVYIDLYDYLQVTPNGSLFAGCPINNIQFTSSEPTIAKTGERSKTDNHYLDILQTGEVDIHAKDTLTGVESVKDLHIIIK